MSYVICRYFVGTYILIQINICGRTKDLTPDQSGATVCSPCPAGNYSAAGAASCAACAAGSASTEGALSLNLFTFVNIVSY